MKTQGLIEVWHDRRIEVGRALDDEISVNLEKADVILLLVSASFTASPYCFSKEMHRAMERHEDKSARVIPVILKPCDWHSAPFGKLLAAPKDGKAVTSWANRDEAFADVAQQVRKVISGLQTVAEPAQTRPLRAISKSLPESEFQVQPAQVRTSNLRLKKEFTQFDRDQYRQDTHEFMAAFFEASLQELEARNTGIQTRFQRVDGRCFTAAVYRDGKSQAACTVRMGGFSNREITYASGENVPAGTSNEMLHIESDNHSLYLKPLGMGRFGGIDKEQLSQQGASEYLWAMFIERLQ